MVDEKIKPCPFCGGAAIIQRGPFEERFVTCADEKKCGGRLNPGFWGTTDEQAVHIWNSAQKVNK